MSKSSYFLVKCDFDDDGTQKYFLSQFLSIFQKLLMVIKFYN